MQPEKRIATEDRRVEDRRQEGERRSGDERRQDDRRVEERREDDSGLPEEVTEDRRIATEDRREGENRSKRDQRSGDDRREEQTRKGERRQAIAPAVNSFELKDPAVQEKGLSFNGKLVVQESVREVNGTSHHHVRLVDGSEHDLTEEEYQTMLNSK